MDLLKSSKRRSVVSEVLYVALNLGLVAAIFGIVQVVDSPWAAVALIFLSKWRVFAVRPRYWMAHIKANLVDVIVGLSVVALLYTSYDSLYVQMGIAILYSLWLLLLKPRSKRLYVTLQAGIASFIGVMALMMVSFDMPASLVVAGMWIVGYACARHVLGSYDEPMSAFYSIVWGLVLAEMGWLLYHWSFGYSIPGINGSIQLSQAALIVLGVSFVAERVYHSYYHHGTIRTADVVLPILLTGSIVLVMLLFFNAVSSAAL